MQHTPPSTYILRNLVDVQVAPPLPWWPGVESLPTGWWAMLIIISLVTVVLFIIGLVHCWKNRYRREAILALRVMQVNSSSNQTELEQQLTINHHAAQQLFYILKQVLVYICPKSANLSGNSVLTELDALIEGKNNQAVFKWQDDLGQRWIACLYNPKIHLSHQDIVSLTKHSRHWLKSHKNQFGFRFLSLIRGQ